MFIKPCLLVFMFTFLHQQSRQLAFHYYKFLRIKIYHDVTFTNDLKEESDMLVHYHKKIWFLSFIKPAIDIS